MCLAKAYLGKGEEAEMIMEDVALLTIEGDTLQLRTLFGEEKEIKGSVKKIDFQDSKVTIDDRD
jgi:predicted RNA-binding protein